jgi:two-component system LytT family response regulator
MIKSLVISDDRLVCALVEQVISSSCPNVTLEGTCAGITEGVQLINVRQPDLVILDVKLNGGSGFDLLRQFSSPSFRIIFISNLLEYALKAFKYNAIDFLLKPVEADELAQAINKATEMIDYEDKFQLKMLGENIKALNKKEKLILKTSNHIHLVNTEDIVRIEADANYSTFYTVDERKILVSRPVKDYEEQLVDQGFFRIHKSHLINISKIKYFDKAEGGYLIMADGATLPVASRKKDMLLDLFESLA